MEHKKQGTSTPEKKKGSGTTLLLILLAVWILYSVLTGGRGGPQ